MRLSDTGGYRAFYSLLFSAKLSVLVEFWSLMKNILEVRDLCVTTNIKELLHGIDLRVGAGETVVILGPNGAGKSTLACAIAGNEYACTGEIILGGKNIIHESADERARMGVFLSYQDPVAIPGLPVAEMLRSAFEARGSKLSLGKFKQLLADNLEKLELNPFAANREMNVNFSGGEKKKMEIVQLIMLKPKLAILDEIDSGLDIDAAKKVSQVLAEYQQKTKAGFVIITHNLRILQALTVNRVYIMRDGAIAQVGDASLLDEIKKRGFKNA